MTTTVRPPSGTGSFTFSPTFSQSGIRGSAKIYSTYRAQPQSAPGRSPMYWGQATYVDPGRGGFPLASRNPEPILDVVQTVPVIFHYAVYPHRGGFVPVITARGMMTRLSRYGSYAAAVAAAQNFIRAHGGIGRGRSRRSLRRIR